MPFIILIAMICGLTTLGVVNAAERISDKYYEVTIAPLMGSVNFTK